MGQIQFRASKGAARQVGTQQAKNNVAWIVADTEDNSPEAIKEVEPGQPAYHRQVTQIAAHASNGKRFYSGKKGRCVDEFLSWLQRQPHVQCWFHNLQYDLGNLFNERLDDLDLPAVVGNRMIRARWRNVEFLDSYNLWRMPLKKLGEAFGLKKGKLDPESKEYLLRDVEIMRKAIGFIYDFCADYGIEKVPATLGGLCVQIWGNLGGENFQCAEDFAHSAFYGGRVELFDKGGEGNFLYTDINSLYPWSMTQAFPADYEWCGTTLPKFGCARALVEFPERIVAPLPLRVDDEIFYPVGKFVGNWTVAELQNLERMGGRIIEVLEAWGSNRGDYPYRKFVETIYERRKVALVAGNEPLATMLKLLMNNLFGRLAMRGKIGRSMLLTEDDQKNGCDGTAYGRKKLVEREIPLPEFTNYLHAAYVTGISRIRLVEFMEKIPKGNLCYADTDSLMFWSESDVPPFPISKELGEMKLEAVANKLRVVVPKGYIFGDEAKAKGVRRAHAEAALNGEEVFWESPFRLREAITYYDRGNSKRLSIWRRVSKTLALEYVKKREKGNLFLPPVFDCLRGENVRIS